MRPRDTNGHAIGRGRYAFAGITVTDPDISAADVRIIAPPATVAIRAHEMYPVAHGARQRDHRGESRRIAAARRWHRDRADCARQFVDMGWDPAVRITATMLNDPAMHTDPAWNRRAIIAATVIDDRRLWAAVYSRRDADDGHDRKDARRQVMMYLTDNGTWSGDLIR